MKRRELTFIIIALVLAAVLGGLVGELIGHYLPEGAAKTLFTKSIVIGFDTTHVDVYALAFTVGITCKINFVSVLCVLLVLIYFRWWYL